MVPIAGVDTTMAVASSFDHRPPMPTRNSSVRYRVEITGIAQGVGFRPHVWRLADRHRLSGCVKNCASGVLLEIQGEPADTTAFLDALQAQPPAQARIRDVHICEIPLQQDHGEFVIVPSDRTSAGTAAAIAPDIAICHECLQELRSSLDRRHNYPFINCCVCGPRFTIMDAFPYDRSATTMRRFSMCADCEREYHDPSNRRFHAQPNACPKCGPHVWFADQSEDIGANHHQESNDPLAIQRFTDAIRRGEIVAVKGVGGFHLACDAANPRAIDTLRQRKARKEKPFAVMALDLDQVATFATFNSNESCLLRSPESPIVLLRKRKDGPLWLEAVAPRNDLVGVMLPYSPLHVLLTQATSPLVMTSGNLSEEPIVRTNSEAQIRLAGLADCFLLHDRDITVACDDSVVRSIHQAPTILRRARGYAPAPIYLPSSGASVLAVGAELKSTFCVLQEDAAHISQHLGDMGDLRTLESLTSNVEHFLSLLQCEPEVVACDQHPDYVSTRWAESFAADRGLPLVRVQHHFAHAAALLGEQIDAPSAALVCVFDGSGWGANGEVWGGEMLIIKDGAWQRAAHLRTFALPGGDASIKRPWHSALAVLSAVAPDACRQLQDRWDHVSDVEFNAVEQRLSRSVRTSSMGRLFDAVAAMLGLRHTISYQGQAAMELESLASQCKSCSQNDNYLFAMNDTEPLEIDWRPLVASIHRDILSGRSPPAIAGGFHHAVARMIRDVCLRLRNRWSIHTVGLSGGVFQNAILSSLAQQQLEDAGFQTLVHQQTPPNDGGLSFGQALVARKRLTIP